MGRWPNKCGCASGLHQVHDACATHAQFELRADSCPWNSRPALEPMLAPACTHPCPTTQNLQVRAVRHANLTNSLTLTQAQTLRAHDWPPTAAEGTNCCAAPPARPTSACRVPPQGHAHHPTARLQAQRPGHKGPEGVLRVPEEPGAVQACQCVTWLATVWPTRLAGQGHQDEASGWSQAPVGLAA